MSHLAPELDGMDRQKEPTSIMHEAIRQRAADLCREINAQGKCGQQIHSMADELMAMIAKAIIHEGASMCADRIIENLTVHDHQMRNAWYGLTPEMRTTFRINLITIIGACFKESK